MSAIQGLGIELYTYVRCPTCGKVLGNLHEEYNIEIKKNIEEAYMSVPRGLSYAEFKDIYDRRFADLFEGTMMKLGIKRYCCKMTLSKPQQVAVGTEPPPGNIAITKYSIIEGTATRNPTRIELTTRSRVPGGSNINMMSMTGYEEEVPANAGGWVESVNVNSFHPKALESFRQNFFPESPIGEKSQKEVLSSAPQETLHPFRPNDAIPTIESEGAVSIKRRPKLKNVVISADKPDMMDISSTENEVFSLPSIENYPSPTNDNFEQLEEMSSSFRTRFNLY